MSVSNIIIGGLGVLIVVLESLQSLYQLQSNWISYRATAEALKHEKFLWLAKAGPYLNPETRNALFAERVESLLSTENSKWIWAIRIASKPWVSWLQKSIGPRGSTTIRGSTPRSGCRRPYLRRNWRCERIKKRQENLSSNCLKKGVHFTVLIFAGAAVINVLG